MIRELRIQNFKCFEDDTVHFGNITLLVGENGTGKSSVIQSLLLLKQSDDSGQLRKGVLQLNGVLSHLGTAVDVLRGKSQSDTVVFDVSFEDGRKVAFRFKYPKGKPDDYFLHSKEHHLAFDHSLLYLSAEREGPRLTYPMSQQGGGTYDVGIHGEFSMSTLSSNGHEPTPNRHLSRIADGTNQALLYQANYWLQNIIGDVECEVESIVKADQVRIGIRAMNDSSFRRASNVGFGITYVLPIVVGALVSTQGSILIVENPEAHLHPRGQSVIGYFLAHVAASGVQVIVESHSDHVLNGMRKAVVDQVVEPNNVSIQFFITPKMDKDKRIITINLDEKGRIDKWPDGFFDQITNDLEHLI
ncbi:MAG: DUF3696 domain-containing protein [Calditrichaeota bacterium]|nr:DUF3696 domain-containing protein [Calditrichota bacterium]MCB9367524.1 DUF3696 domain-containing protein [Calditrichota bacterium]